MTAGYAILSAAIIGVFAYFASSTIEDWLGVDVPGGVWSRLVAPLVGGALMAFSAYLLVDNRGSFAAAEGVPFVEAIPRIFAAVFVLGAIGLRPWNARLRQSVPVYES